MKSLILKKTKRGLGVFANRNFIRGDILLEFKGKIIFWPGNELPKDVPSNYNPDQDHYLQLEKDVYMGPSGKIDDSVNHSCGPNSGIIFKGKRIFLVTRHPINRGEEITWDYSTDMDEDEWVMKCSCGDKNCRKMIKDFKYLPLDLQNKYIREGIVAPFILKTHLKR